MLSSSQKTKKKKHLWKNKTRRRRTHHQRKRQKRGGDPTFYLAMTPVTSYKENTTKPTKHDFIYYLYHMNKLNFFKNIKDSFDLVDHLLEIGMLKDGMFYENGISIKQPPPPSLHEKILISNPVSPASTS